MEQTEQIQQTQQQTYGMTAGGKWNALVETPGYKANYQGCPKFLGWGKWAKDFLISLVPGSSVVNMGRVVLAIEERDKAAERVYDELNPGVPTRRDYNSNFQKLLGMASGGYAASLLEAPMIAEGIKLANGNYSDQDIAILGLYLAGKTVVNSALRFSRNYAQNHTKAVRSLEGGLEQEVSCVPFLV